MGFSLLLLVLPLCWPVVALGQDQTSNIDSSSSDDIMVADGLQLPGYGVMWAMDTWRGVKELVQLGRPDASCGRLSLLPSRKIELKGEAARVRIHDTQPQFFLHGVTGEGNISVASFVIVSLDVVGNCRRSKLMPSKELTAKARAKRALPEGVFEMEQERVGMADWYRLRPKQPLPPGEYAIVPLPGDAIAVTDGIRDFAIDPEARENSRAIRSEKDREIGNRN